MLSERDARGLLGKETRRSRRGKRLRCRRAARLRHTWLTGQDDVQDAVCFRNEPRRTDGPGRECSDEGKRPRAYPKGPHLSLPLRSQRALGAFVLLAPPENVAARRQRHAAAGGATYIQPSPSLGADHTAESWTIAGSELPVPQFRHHTVGAGRWRKVCATVSPVGPAQAPELAAQSVVGQLPVICRPSGKGGYR